MGEGAASTEKSGARSGNCDDVRGGVRSAEVAVEAGEDRDDVREELLPVRVDRFALADDQGPFGPLVVVMGDLPLRGQSPRGGDGVVEDQLLLPVEDSRQVHVRGDADLAEEIEDRRDGETGDHLEVLLVGVIQFVESGPHAERVEDHVLPVVVLLQGADLFADCIHVECHSYPP